MLKKVSKHIKLISIFISYYFIFMLLSFIILICSNVGGYRISTLDQSPYLGILCEGSTLVLFIRSWRRKLDIN